MAIFGGKPKTEKTAAATSRGPGLVQAGSGEKKVKAKDKKLKADTKLAYRVLLRPIISEKGTILAEANTYLFRVAKSASKPEIARAVYHVYGTMPIRVRVINVLGKRRKSGRSQGQTQNWKKAVVVLPAGQKIQIYEGV
jgi:large subunit ribosomal protein L23